MPLDWLGHRVHKEPLVLRVLQGLRDPLVLQVLPAVPLEPLGLRDPLVCKENRVVSDSLVPRDPLVLRVLRAVPLVPRGPRDPPVLLVPPG